jgi:hypothetical protein
MTTRPTRHEINCETGEEFFLPFTDEEMEQRDKDLAAIAKSQADDLEVEVSKAALLEKLGITADEAKLLLA